MYIPNLPPAKLILMGFYDCGSIVELPCIFVGAFYLVFVSPGSDSVSHLRCFLVEAWDISILIKQSISLLTSPQRTTFFNLGENNFGVQHTKVAGEKMP